MKTLNENMEKDYEELYNKMDKDYEQNFSKMSLKQEGVRYLKIRTLVDIEPLEKNKELRDFLGISDRVRREKIDEIRKKLFCNQHISNQKLDELLKKTYLELRPFRNIDSDEIKSSVSKITQEGDNYWKAWNSVYRDDIRRYIQHHFVRTVNIKSYEDLLKKIDEELDPVIKGYVVISWYNQWCSTVIEDFILTHQRVVPAARRIDKVDFFFLDIPFDLKISFIPRGFIDQMLKNKIISKEEDIIDKIKENPKDLIKWFYENQGESRFSDSHRLFIVLADRKNLKNSWKLKANFDIIQKEINNFFNKCQSKSDINIVEWEFKNKGKFETYSYLILVEN